MKLKFCVMLSSTYISFKLIIPFYFILQKCLKLALFFTILIKLSFNRILQFYSVFMKMMLSMWQLVSNQRDNCYSINQMLQNIYFMTMNHLSSIYQGCCVNITHIFFLYYMQIFNWQPQQSNNVSSISSAVKTTTNEICISINCWFNG